MMNEIKTILSDGTWIVYWLIGAACVLLPTLQYFITRKKDNSMTNYVKGRTLEYEVMNLFKSAGWKVVRSAGSHSPFDLVAIKQTTTKHKETWLVVFAQCKVKKRDQKKICTITPSTPTGMP